MKRKSISTSVTSLSVFYVALSLSQASASDEANMLMVIFPQLDAEVAQCKPISNIVDSLEIVACSFIVDSVVRHNAAFQPWCGAVCDR